MGGKEAKKKSQAKKQAAKKEAEAKKQPDNEAKKDKKETTVEVSAEKHDAIVLKSDALAEVVEERFSSSLPSACEVSQLDQTGSTVPPLPAGFRGDMEDIDDVGSPGRHEGATEVGSPGPAVTPHGDGYETASDPPTPRKAQYYNPVLGQPGCQMPDNWDWKADGVVDYVPGMEGMDGSILPADSYLSPMHQQMQLSAMQAPPGAVLVPVPIVTGATYPGHGASAIAVGGIFPDMPGTGFPDGGPHSVDANGGQSMSMEGQEDWQREEELIHYKQRAEHMEEKLQRIKSVVENERLHLLKEVAALKAVLNRYMIPHDEIVPHEEPQVQGEGPDSQHLHGGGRLHGRLQDGMPREPGGHFSWNGVRHGMQDKDNMWPSPSDAEHGMNGASNGCGHHDSMQVMPDGSMCQGGVAYDVVALGDMGPMGHMMNSMGEPMMFGQHPGDPMFALNGALDGLGHIGPMDGHLMMNGDLNGHINGDITGHIHGDINGMHGHMNGMNDHLHADMMNGMGSHGHIDGCMPTGHMGGHADGCDSATGSRHHISESCEDIVQKDELTQGTQSEIDKESDNYISGKIDGSAGCVQRDVADGCNGAARHRRTG
eukprot:TRINITY_DN9030_c0_g1_i2.p1 TRINITY_DN9030_c0_g1~~TRINITY_DN9030_c0_g1_i2.p1  ORF type:complete len:599 (-),score=129.24 TRINITY_DN9030_c0_g1_i2:298-2094(-)